MTSAGSSATSSRSPTISRLDDYRGSAEPPREFSEGLVTATPILSAFSATQALWHRRRPLARHADDGTRPRRWNRQRHVAMAHGEGCHEGGRFGAHGGPATGGRRRAGR